MNGFYRRGGAVAAVLSALAFSTAAGDADPTAPNLPPEVKPAPAGPERPKIRYWLDDPAAAAEKKPREAEPAPADPEAEPLPSPTAEEFTEQPTHQIVGDEPVIEPANSVAQRDAGSRRAALHAEICAKLAQAKECYKAGNYQKTVQIARNILSADPRNIEAAEWFRKAQGRLSDADERVTAIAGERRDREAVLETDEHAVRPPPRLPTIRPRFARRGDGEDTARRRSMAQRLDERVTVDFMKADLEWVLNTLFILTGVNIIADQAALEGKSLTLHVENLPLKEVLNFIVRNNEGIQYSITEDAVWITASESTDLKKIMFPRVYPLHHGLVSSVPGSGASTGERSGGTGRAGTNRGGGGGGGGGGASGGGEETYIETVLKWIKEVKDPYTFPEGSEYIIDRQSNQLIVHTTPAGHQKISEFLDYFDQPAIQVLIKARFLDISSEGEKSIGVNLDTLNTRVATVDATTGESTGGNPNPFRVFDFKGGTQPINVPGALGLGNVFTITGIRTDPQFKASLALLLNNRQTKILSEPQILAINNKEAVIDITTHFSYITDLRPVTTTNAVGNGTAVQNVSAFVPEFDEENIGFTLVVTPSVGRDLKTINLHLNPVIDTLAQGQQITQFQSFDVTQVNQNTQVPPVIQRPTIDQTSLETDVVLEDNGYVIIGGLLRNRQEVRERKIPGLHRIPYLGNLFKSKSTNVLKSNLMIIVEAQIITPGGRTYYRDPVPDDADIREGGVPKAPGQTSDATRPDNVNSALGLALAKRPQPPSQHADAGTANSGEQPDPSRSIHAPPRKTRSTPVPVPADPATAIAQMRNEKVAPRTPEPADPEAAQPEPEPAPAAEKQPAIRPDEMTMGKGLTPRERMERLAKASQGVSATGSSRTSQWALAEEEGSSSSDGETKPAASNKKVRGEVIGD